MTGYDVLTLIALSLAIVGGLNTVLEFSERMHTYYQALRKRRLLLLPSFPQKQNVYVECRLINGIYVHGSFLYDSDTLPTSTLH